MRAAVVNAGNAKPRPASRGCRRPAMCERLARARPGPCPSLSRRPGDRRAAAGRRGAGGIARPRAGSPRMAAGPSRRDPDHRPLAEEVTLSAGGVTISAQAKGAGMIQPDSRPCSASCRPTPWSTTPRRPAAAVALLRADTVDGQMSTNDTVLLQATGEAGAPLPTGCSRRSSCSSRSRSSPTVRARPGRRSRSRAPPTRSRPSGSRGDRELAAGQDRPVGRDPNWGRIAQAAGMALAGEDLDEIGSDSIDAPSSARTSPRPRSGCGSTGVNAAHATSAT